MATKLFPDNCLKCGKFVHDAFWLYNWKGKNGYCCKSCGQEIHKAGYALLDKAETLMKKEGIDVVESKEKFGNYRLVATIQTKKQDKFMIDLLENYTKEHSDFNWEWRWF